MFFFTTFAAELAHIGTKMGKFDAYNIPVKGLPLGRSTFEYVLDNAFFALIGEEEVQRGCVEASVVAEKDTKQTELHFSLTGKIVVPCDRCLEDMEQPIKASGHLIVRLGKEFQDDGDDVVIIPEEQGVLNISWFMYEFINLAIPLKHIHALGLCNKESAAKLREYMVQDGDSNDDGTDDAL